MKIKNVKTGFLLIDGKAVATVKLKKEKAISGWGVQEVGRRWFDWNRPMKSVTVMIGNGDDLEYELSLSLSKTESDQVMYRGEMKSARTYVWATLTKGAAKSWGLTIGYIERAPKVEKIPESWRKSQRQEAFA